MGSFSIWHWIFGTGKVSGLMGDFAKGIKAFKKGLADDDEPGAKPTIEANTANEQAREKDRATTG